MINEKLSHRFLLESKLGTGAMSSTYLAKDLLRDDTVSIKLVPSTNPEFLDVLRNEFALLKGITHPHLLQLRDFGRARIQETDYCYYVADYIDGQPLDAFSAQKNFDEIKRPLLGVIEALCFLHSQKILHCDVKPSNILVDAHGRGTLIDFGGALPFGSKHLLVGTPEFLPHHLAIDKTDLDHRIDLYGLGVTLLHVSKLLTTALPDQIDELAHRLTSADQTQPDIEEVLDIFVQGDPWKKGTITPRAFAIPTFSSKILGREAVLRIFDEALDSLVNKRSGARTILIEGPDGIGRSRVLSEMKWRAQMSVARVVEGSPSEANVISSMLGRALDRRAPGQDLEDILQYATELDESAEPSVFVLDDLHRLNRRDAYLLKALFRLRSTTSSCLYILASRDKFFQSSPSVRVLHLDPLEKDELRTWVSGRLPDDQIDDLMKATGGYPGYVHSFLSRLTSDYVSRSEFFEASYIDGRDGLRLDLLLDRPTGAIHALSFFALIARYGNGASKQDLDQMGISLDDVARLVQQGWCYYEHGHFRLARFIEAPKIESELDPDTIEDLHREIASWSQSRFEEDSLPEQQKECFRGRYLFHCFLSGQREVAEEAFLSMTSKGHLCPDIWHHVASVFARKSQRKNVLIEVARLEELLGNPNQALSILSDLLNSENKKNKNKASKEEKILRLRIASCLIKLGRGSEAIEHLKSLHETEDDPEAKAMGLDLEARALIKSSDYKKARTVAESGLKLPLPDGILADLFLDAGLAASSLDDNKAAEEYLDRAKKLYESSDDPHGLIRASSYTALHSFRKGNIEEAARGYATSLKIAERNHLDDQIAPTLLNLATASHQMGDLGSAHKAYERGLKIATALGLVSTEMTLRYDLGLLFYDIGLFDRSIRELEQAEIIARAEKIRRVEGCCLSLRGEVEIFHPDGNPDEAEDLLERAKELLEAEGAKREAAEVDLHTSELSLKIGDLDRCESRIDTVSPQLTSLGIEDLEARSCLLRARLEFKKGSVENSLTSCERALQLAQKIGQKLLIAEIELFLSQVYDAEGSSYLANKHYDKGREIIERLATRLPKAWRKTFVSHPKRNTSTSETAQPQVKPDLEEQKADSDDTEARLFHLLEINKRLNSSLDKQSVLRSAMDAAIDLTGAERGFVILRQEGTDELDVPVARNIDRERLYRTHLKFSNSIAKEVITTGEPMIVLDAERDDRFQDTSSVHVMHLKSVACVPITSPEGILGALYLDNRFQRGRFSEQEMSLLLAFADQVAISIQNSRLHAELSERKEELEKRTRELEKRTCELDAEKLRVEQLLVQQAGEIDRLSHELKGKNADLKHDYSSIVGTSSAMRSVFEKLDRVIETSLTVLIEGESGTGKELIARAIHSNGPRSAGPFVVVNCAAVPDSLLEAELFGSVRGAFTGSLSDRLGYFQAASGGTLFLDEIGEMPLGMQTKLLRATQEREVVPVGGQKPIGVDVRLLCATNRNLMQEVSKGRFREDLYYRLAVVEIKVPPLRDRIEDIRVLTEFFVEKICERLSREPPVLDPSIWQALKSADWPGNVRQLENTITRSVVFSMSKRLSASELELHEGYETHFASKDLGPLTSRKSYEHKEAKRLSDALEREGWNVKRTAKKLGIPRSTMYNKLKKYGLHKPGKGRS